LELVYARNVDFQYQDTPEDISGGIPEYFWGYNRMMTVDGLFGAGDAVGGTPHAFSSGSFTEGRLSAKAACKYIDDGLDQQSYLGSFPTLLLLSVGLGKLLQLPCESDHDPQLLLR
jgi:hypothetical protein